MIKPINVISLFDGAACGLQALKEEGIPVNEYHAFENDKYAIQIAMKNHPEIIQHGEVTFMTDFSMFRGFDLLIAGSPCQGFSFAGDQLNFSDKRSQLFFEFVRAKQDIKPKKFLLENVRMKKEYEEIISHYLGVQPILINSALVSAQNRQRFYWSNLKITQPEDKNILLEHIVHEYADGMNKDNLTDYIIPFKSCIKILNSEVKRGKIGYFSKDGQSQRIYMIHNKSVTLQTASGKIGSYLFGCITPDRLNKRQNGQRFNDGNKYYTLTTQDRHGVIIDGYIRKLTPVEWERLQTLPDNYTDGVSNNQRYKMLGSAWTVEIIKHIFSEGYKNVS